LQSGALYEDRDLMPTMDVRAFAGLAMQGLFGLDRSDLERVVFPGADLSDGQPIIL
jgi:uncharacterized protein (DUF1501 family)